MKSPVVILYNAAGVAMAVADGVAIPVDTSSVLVAGSDGTNARRVRTAADGSVSTGGLVTTAAPSYTNGQTSALSLTTAGALRVSGSATVAGGLTNNNAAPAADHVGSLTSRANAAPPTWTEGNEVLLSSDLSGRLRTDNTAWLGSTAPTVGQKPMASSVPVTLASDQVAIPVTFAPAQARTGVVSAIITLGGGTANTLNIMRSTTYTEPASAAQRSVSSASVNDTAAGTGARSVEIKYYDNAGNGPLATTVTLNGTTPVNTSVSDIRFIESMEVITAGSGGVNAGIITLFGSTAGGGGTVGTIGVGNLVTGIGDNRTLWAHHYTATGYRAELAVFVVSAQSGGSGTSARFLIKEKAPLVANGAEVLIGDVLLVQGGFQRTFDFHPFSIGFSRFTAYGIPGVNNATLNASFDFAETVYP